MIKEIKQIAEHYGYENQSFQLIEEMAELTVAINHNRRNPSRENFKNLIEEIADVDLCLEQIKYLLHAKELVNIAIIGKILRQLERIKTEEAEEAEDKK